MLAYFTVKNPETAEPFSGPYVRESTMACLTFLILHYSISKVLETLPLFPKKKKLIN